MLSDTEKSKIRVVLGYDASEHGNVNARLESILEATVPEAEVQIRTALDAISQIDNALITTGLTSAGISKVDEVQFQKPGAVRKELQDVGRMYIGRISIVLGVPIAHNYYAVHGFSEGPRAAVESPKPMFWYPEDALGRVIKN